MLWIRPQRAKCRSHVHLSKCPISDHFGISLKCGIGDLHHKRSEADLNSNLHKLQVEIYDNFSKPDQIFLYYMQLRTEEAFTGSLSSTHLIKYKNISSLPVHIVKNSKCMLFHCNAHKVLQNP
jgi:hypothetical protein